MSLVIFFNGQIPQNLEVFRLFRINIVFITANHEENEMKHIKKLFAWEKK